MNDDERFEAAARATYQEAKARADEAERLANAGAASGKRLPSERTKTFARRIIAMLHGQKQAEGIVARINGGGGDDSGNDGGVSTASPSPSSPSSSSDIEALTNDLLNNMLKKGKQP